MFGTKKEEQALQRMADHIDRTNRCFLAGKKLFASYVLNDHAACEKLWQEVQKREHEADIIRRDVYLLLSKGAFLPILRADLHRFLDVLDEVAGVSEDLADKLLCEHPVLPEIIIPELQTIFAKTQLQMETLMEVVTLFLQNHHSRHAIVDDAVQRIFLKEHEIDELEHSLTRTIFGLSLPMAEKLHLKQTLTQLAEISNRIEDVADCLSQIMVKMQV